MVSLSLRRERETKKAKQRKKRIEKRERQEVRKEVRSEREERKRSDVEDDRERERGKKEVRASLSVLVLQPVRSAQRLGLFRLCCQYRCAFLQGSEHMSAATVFFGLLASLGWIVTSLYLVAPAVDVLPFLCRVSPLCFGFSCNSHSLMDLVS